MRLKGKGLNRKARTSFTIENQVMFELERFANKNNFYKSEVANEAIKEYLIKKGSLLV